MEKKRTPLPNGGKAVGAYLKVLRESKNLSPTEVAAALRTDATQIWRIEGWKGDVRSSLLFAFIKLVDGSATDVADLINSPNNTESDGIAKAEARLSSK